MQENIKGFFKISSIVGRIFFILFLLNITTTNTQGNFLYITPRVSIDLYYVIQITAIIIIGIICLILHKKTNIYNNKIFQICGIIYL